MLDVLGTSTRECGNHSSTIAAAAESAGVNTLAPHKRSTATAGCHHDVLLQLVAVANCSKASATTLADIVAGQQHFID